MAEVETTYCLHIRPDGTEVKFPQPEFKLDRFKRVIADPHVLPHHEVTVKGKWEYVRTANTKGGHFTPLSPIPPRGEGWKIFDHSADKWTMWRRPVRRKNFG
jgi:hypothetical protein